MDVTAPSASLGTIGRRHWRHFLPMWLLPVGMFLASFLPGFAQHANLYFWLVMVPVGAVAMYVANIPRRRGLVSTAQALFWVIVVPVVIWAVTIFGLFGLVFALRAA
jgi:hypothetical protein